MLHLGPDAGLDLLHLVYQRINGVVLLVQRFALAWAHRHMPGDVLAGIGALVRALVARIPKGVCLLTMQQTVAFHDIRDVARGADHRMHQARVRVHANMGLHAKVPLVALLARVHLWIALFVLVLGGAGCCDQGGVHGCSCFEQQALGCQKLIDGGQNLIGQFVPFQPVTEAQDGALVRHSSMGIEPCKIPVERGVEGFLHAQIRQAEPLLHAVDAQHGLQRKGGGPSCLRGNTGQ